MDISDLPGAVQALERGEAMTEDVLFFFLFIAVSMFLLVLDGFIHSIRKGRRWKEY